MPGINQRRIGKINLIAYQNCDYAHTLTVTGRDLSSSTFYGQVYDSLGCKLTDLTITNSSVDISIVLTSLQIDALPVTKKVNKFDYFITERVLGFDRAYVSGELEIQPFRNNA